VLQFADIYNQLRTSKNDTLREIHLYLSADLQVPSCPIAGALPEITARVTENFSELHYLPEGDSPISGVIKFKRNVKSRYDHNRKAWIPLDESRWEWDGTIVVIVTAEEVTDMISNAGLREWVNDVRLAMGMRPLDQMMIMIKGLAKHYSKLKSQQNREYTAAARAGLGGKEQITTSRNTVKLVGKEEIEVELVKVQMETKCFLVHGKPVSKQTCQKPD
jgi:crossover junction endonuclease EME1